jgi:hypothetical protein
MCIWCAVFFVVLFHVWVYAVRKVFMVCVVCVVCQKRPTIVSKETYYSVKRDLQ